jgi:sulfatase modifying factor 1
MVQINIKAGRFWMGCAEGDNDCNRDEKPGRLVYLDEYSIDKTEVTVSQYGKCVDAGACTHPDAGKDCNLPKKDDRKDHPINCVN